MSTALVRWNDLIPYFEILFPNTIRDALDNHIVALVRFSGHDFEIRPKKGNAHAFEVFGLPFLFPNENPNPIAIL